MFDLATAEPEVCPYLGLPDDPRTRFTFADPAHRCHVGAKPIAIDLGHQGAYCLTTGYPACKRFRLPKAAGRQGSSPAGEGRGRSRGRALLRVGSLVAILAVVAVVGAIRAGAIGGSPADGGAPGVVATPVATGTPRSAPVIHVVVRDDTLTAIAVSYGVTVKAIQDANNIPDPSPIRVGDRLVIPPPP